MMALTPRLVRRPAGPQGTWPPDLLPLLRRVYAARGCLDIQSAQPRLAHLAAPCQLSHIDTAVQLLADAIALRQTILVVGDFDCDGATACALAVRGLRLLGARHVCFAVPHRMIHGYGLSPAFVEELTKYQPDLLLTVDHGIACHAGVAAAKAHGWKIIVTDHHLPGATWPAADAIVNPNLQGDLFPSKSLAGVGVVFYVLLALRAYYRQHQPQSTWAQADLTTLLDLVAVGTVADLVPLDTNNRALVAAGLRRIRRGHACVGLRALIQRSGKDCGQLTASEIGFALAPRLNAAGRLKDMALGVELLLVDAWDQAWQIAEQLETMNAQRKQMQQAMLDVANDAISTLGEPASSLSPGLCLYDPQWHPGIIGLVAAKMSERYHRPVIALAPSEPGSDLLRGSARSTATVHLRDLLAQLQLIAPGCMESFGGHAKAAGLTLRKEHLPRFQQAFAQIVAENHLTLEQGPVIESDGELASNEFDYQHAKALRFAGPWGQHFPEPIFDGVFEVIRWRVIKARHLSLCLRSPGQTRLLDAIYFHGWHGVPPARQIRCAYRLCCDEYKQRESIVLIVEHVWLA